MRPIVRAERVFDGERALPGGAAVFVEGRRIVGVEPVDTPVPDGWQLVDLPGTTLLPGPVETHCHLGSDSHDGGLQRMAEADEALLEQAVDDALARQLAAGVTTVRDLGDRDWSVVRRRDLAGRDGGAAGSRPVPAIVASGPPITVQGGHCAFVGGAVAGADAVRAAVRDRAERGVDVVKVMGSGGVNTAGSDVARCRFALEEVRLVVDGAHAAGLPVIVHAHALAAVDQALDAGADGIEHCSCLTDRGVDLSDALLERLARQGTTVCPTLGVVPGGAPPPAVRAVVERFGFTLELRRHDAARMHRSGVRLVSGSDAGVNGANPHGVRPPPSQVSSPGSRVAVASSTASASGPTTQVSLGGSGGFRIQATARRPAAAAWTRASRSPAHGTRGSGSTARGRADGESTCWADDRRQASVTTTGTGPRRPTVSVVPRAEVLRSLRCRRCRLVGGVPDPRCRCSHGGGERGAETREGSSTILRGGRLLRRHLASIGRTPFGLRVRNALSWPRLSIDLPFSEKGVFVMAEKAKGKMEQAKGKAKEVAGKVTGNERMQAEGKTDQVKGKGHEAANKAKEQARGVKDSLRDRRQP
ncbi:amidohydrolase family protein [Streptomyces litmocidini]|uniref:amidohydrolase family protein n=1 Tax=Streptomyces litmocidini TaxID=67318 RepID=UPI0036F876EA